MTTTLTIVRYPKWFGWAGFLSMALFRFSLWMNKKITFWKLLGCGKNGTFDIHPDWRQWGILVAGCKLTDYNYINYSSLYGNFITRWWQLFKCEKWTIILDPIEGHGTWDGKECFGNLPKQSDYDGAIAVLTRASIRINRLKNFWQHVDAVANRMHMADGFITSIGIGEAPWIRQATFSIWKSKEHMKNFAYQMQEHKEVIRKTRQEKWYSEDMFVRFKILACEGTINGSNPLNGAL